MRESAVRFPICARPAGVPRRIGADARALEDDAGAGGLVVDLEHLRGGGKYIAQLNHYAVMGDDRHVGPEAVVPALIDGQHAGLVAAAGADHLRGYRRSDVALLEPKHGLQALSLERVFRDGRLRNAHAGKLLLQVLVLLAHVAEVDVIGPAVVQSRSRRPWAVSSNGVTVAVAHLRMRRTLRPSGWLASAGARTCIARAIACASRTAIRNSAFLNRVMNSMCLPTLEQFPNYCDHRKNLLRYCPAGRAPYAGSGHFVTRYWASRGAPDGRRETSCRPTGELREALEGV